VAVCHLAGSNVVTGWLRPRHNAPGTPARSWLVRHGDPRPRVRGRLAGRCSRLCSQRVGKGPVHCALGEHSVTSSHTQHSSLVRSNSDRSLQIGSSPAQPPPHRLLITPMSLLQRYSSCTTPDRPHDRRQRKPLPPAGAQHGRGSDGGRARGEPCGWCSRPVIHAAPALQQLGVATHAPGSVRNAVRRATRALQTLFWAAPCAARCAPCL
jgi:hypothetical protein